MNAAHEFQSAPQDFLDLERLPERRPMRWLIPGILPEGFSLIVGRPKAGKTTLMAQMALELTRGGTLWGRPAARRRVAIISPERPDQIEDIIRSIREKDGWGSGVIELRRPGRFPWPLNRHLDWWRDLLERLGPGGVVFIDPLADALEIEDLNDRAQVARALNPLRLEAAARGVSVVAVHHLNKALYGERGVLGSTGFAAAADALLFLYPRRKGQEATLKGIGSRMPEFAVRLHRIPIEEGVAIWEAPEARKAPTAPAVPALGQNGQKAREDAPRLTARERRILEDLALHGPSAAREIAARTRIPDKAVRKALYALRDVGLVQEVGERPRSSYRGGRPEKVYCAAYNIPEPRRDILGSAGILASESTIPQNAPECPTIPHNAPIYTQGHSRGGILESADGDSLSNAGITLKDVEIRRNRTDMSSISSE